ncbi:MAG: hypothetical protein AB1428_04070 [Bacteroidota bacterium]
MFPEDLDDLFPLDSGKVVERETEVRGIRYKVTLIGIGNHVTHMKISKGLKPTTVFERREIERAQANMAWRQYVVAEDGL